MTEKVEDNIFAEILKAKAEINEAQILVEVELENEVEVKEFVIKYCPNNENAYHELPYFNPKS